MKQIAGLLLALTMASVPAMALDTGLPGHGVRIEPYSGMDGRQPVACGLRVSTGAAAATLAALRRPPGTAFRVAVATGASSVALMIDGAAVTLAPVAALAGEGFAAEATRADAGALMQALMLRGGVLTLTPDGSTPAALEIVGPVSQSVRALYLNCAGDLYQQER